MWIRAGLIAERGKNSLFMEFMWIFLFIFAYEPSVNVFHIHEVWILSLQSDFNRI